MRSKGVGKVVRDGEGVIDHLIIVAEELRTERHIDVLAIEDIHKGELSRRTLPLRIGSCGIGDHQLIGRIVTKAAIQLTGKSVDLIQCLVPSIGESNSGLRDTTHRESRLRSRCPAGSVPAIIIEVIVAEGEVVIIVDVPVDLRQDLVVLLIQIGEVADITGVVVVLLLEELAHRLEVGIAGAGDVVLIISDTVLTREEAGVGTSVILILCTGEEEELILDDRTTDGEAVGLLILIIKLGHINVTNLGAGHPLTTLVGVG